MKSRPVTQGPGSLTDRASGLPLWPIALMVVGVLSAAALVSHWAAWVVFAAAAGYSLSGSS